MSRPFRRRLPQAVLSCLAGCSIVALAGCAQTGSSTTLPDLKRTSTDGMLTPAQQKQQIADIARRKAEEDAAAVKTIEKTR